MSGQKRRTNIAALLGRWGQRVLIIDWDLEAPGLERFFGPRVRGFRTNTPGLVDMIGAFSQKQELDWHTCLLKAAIPQGKSIDILHAGQADEGYVERLNSIDWEKLFELGTLKVFCTVIVHIHFKNLDSF